MKSSRPLLYGATAVVLVLLLAVGLALTPSVQTWIVRRVIASRPGLHLRIGRVSAGFSSVSLSDVSYTRGDVTLTAPRVEAKLPVLSSLLFERVQIYDLVAHGWTLTASGAPIAANSDQTLPAGAAAQAVAPSPLTAAAPAVVASGSIAPPVISGDASSDGLLPFRLPVDVSIERVDLNGEIVLPAARGRAKVAITGGGLRNGGEGRFSVDANATLREATVNVLDLRGTIALAMTSPRSVGRITGNLQATATGGRLAEPVQLTLGFGVARVATGESYSVRLTNPQRTLLGLDATRPDATHRISGRWTIDMRDADVVPFALGRALPTFAAVGEGEADTDSAFSVVHAAGRLDATVDRLATLDPQLSAVGSVHLTADVDVSQQNEVLSVAKLDLTVAANRGRDVVAGPTGAAVPTAAAQTVATIRALQSFEFNPYAGAVLPTDSGRDLVGVTLQGVPLQWAKPFLGRVGLAGGDITGELVATPRAGGFTVRTKKPISVAGLTIEHSGRTMLQHVDVSVNASGDYNQHGWQAELSGVTAKSGAATVLLIDAKAGQLAGDHQPIKTTGLLSVDLAALLDQPIARGLVALQRGDATVEFAGSLGPTQQFEAKVAVKNLVADPRFGAQSLPTVSADVRADIGADGRLTLNAPVGFEREGRKSDLTIVGTFAQPSAGGAFEAQATSTQFVVQDAKVLGALVRPAPSAGARPAPLWTGMNGSVALRMGRVIYSDAFQLSNVVGTLRLAGGVLTFDNVRSGVGDGQMTLNGKLMMHPERREFRADTEVALVDFDPGPIFRSRIVQSPPLFEGKFAIDSRLAARSTSLEDLPEVVTGDFTATSKSGIFRALPVSVGNLVENSSKLATWLSSAGNAIAGLVSRKEDVDEIANRSQAVNELAKDLSAIPYDQLRMVLSRDEMLNTTVKEFTVISPDVRLSGSGRALHVPGHSISDDQVTLELQLRARGRVAERLKYLGLLDPKTDDLGYAACTIPMEVSGSLAALDGRDFSNRLIASAVSKTGILDKAGARAMDWINRLRGRF